MYYADAVNGACYPEEEGHVYEMLAIQLKLKGHTALPPEPGNLKAEYSPTLGARTFLNDETARNYHNVLLNLYSTQHAATRDPERAHVLPQIRRNAYAPHGFIMGRSRINDWPKQLEIPEG
ncbi:hypothetical protein CPB83DRAFT_832316 [Crepidotus variabilis]|uniref:Uncharacterized protein n=1 Tax=Crepidotus variabilis TaxID=179855 RepID=A0A9P6EQ62_9AGAR|nr:hypothetical protein CPB83DRAFT_832316 [Crepidotus variabilis]